MKMLQRVGVVGTALVSGTALAAGPDMTALTGAVDFGTITAAILAVAALVVVPYLAFKGAKIVIRAIKGA